MKFLKIHRLIKNYFGNYKNFVAWCVAVAIAVFTIDSLITPRFTHPKTRHTKSGDIAVSTRSIAAETEEQNPEEKAFNEELEQVEKGEGGGGGGGKGDGGGGGGGAERQQKLLPKKQVVYAAHCGLAYECRRGTFSFYVRSGYGKDTSAIMCFNENYIMAEGKVTSDRGMNMIVINDATLNVEEIKVFDVYSSDALLISYLRNNIKDNHIIFVASHDEASFNLSAAARKEFYKFGSSILDKVNFRDNYVIIGQRGLALGQAIEALQPRREDMQFAESSVLSGCMTIPVGKKKGEMQKANIKNEPNKAAAAPDSSKGKAVEAPAAKLPAPQDIRKPGAEKMEKKPPEPPKANEKEKEKVVEKADKKEKKKEGGAIQLGEEQLNCGVKSLCNEPSIAVHLYTGFQAKDLPKICVNGKYVMSSGLNNAGRGLNFVVFDPNTKEVTRVARFDTYSTDDNALELFLEMLNEDEIVLAVAHDEASLKLDKSIRELIEGIGSSFISRLSFRDVWAFVGQKGIKGFSPYEEFEFSEANSERQILTWPTPIDLRICVPPKLKALSAKKVQLRNELRRSFCRKYDGYAEFCSKENIDKELIPAPPVDKSLANDPIFSVPISVVAGLEYNSLRRQLETLLTNPGIRLEMVKVFYDEKFEEAGELATVFNITSHKLESSVKYTELMQKAIETSWKLFPKAKYAIILEEEVFPSSDFLNFFRQCLPPVEADDTLAGVSAWNDNAYQGRAGVGSLAYRVEMLPGMGFLLKRSFYEQHLKSRMDTCCMRRSWEGWSRDEIGDFEMVVPDISRVERGQYNGRLTELLKELFRRPRETTGFRGQQLKLSNVNSLETEKYESQLEEMIPTLGSLNQTELQKCINNENAVYPIDTITKGSFAVYYKQETTTDEVLLYSLCRCFRLFHVPKYRVRGTHRGLVRFSHGDHLILLIGSETEYFSRKPKSAQVLQLQTKTD